jgi:alpha-1,3-rhamnosyl/mannosyltransferase
MRNSHRLVLVGKRGWSDDEIVSLAHSVTHVEWMEYQTDDACERLLSAAVVFAFPSLYEGFGMPILDAFRTGVPVLTSEIGSMKEVAGDAALLVDPTSIDSIGQGLEKLLTDPELRAQFSLKGKKRAEEFSWAKTVDIFLESLSS